MVVSTSGRSCTLAGSLSHFTHDVKYENKMIDSVMKKQMLADDIGGRDVSEDSARRDSRDRKHKFLHDFFLSEA